MAAAPFSITNGISRNLLKPGIISLRTHIQSELSDLRRAPILLITSRSQSSPNLKTVSDSCQLIQFTFGQQFCLRTVPTVISSAFPTKESLQETLELMRRTGASTVVSVGSGAAMDLAKAVQANHEEKRNNGVNNNRLILVPTTYGGVLAAGSSHSLLLDNENETLVPYPRNNQNIDTGNIPAITTVSTLDYNKYMEPVNDAKFDELLYAVSAILLDSGLRKRSHPTLSMLLQKTIDLISLRNNNSWSDNTNCSEATTTTLSEAMPLITNLLYQSAGLLSCGIGAGDFEEDDRSITIALGSSLIPTIFPETHPLSFIAGLIPGLCHYHSDISTRDQSNTDVKKRLQKLVELLQQRPPEGGMNPPPSLETRDESLKGFSIPDMALSHIQSNQAVWEPFDVPDDVLMNVLQHSLK
mmetsp:Transcript_52377/g.56831  ORF Transcript_52377/g.56831 Transcript_52377/m.56831 type:complete len:413 (+) Transcript_52377:35-1273(+)